jgi:hypothetical protein
VLNRGRKASFFVVCIIISFISVFAIEACYDKVQASSFLLDKDKRRVVLLLADCISIEDFTEDECLKAFFDTSYCAFISGRQNGKATAHRAKLAIGAGRRLELEDQGVNAFDSQNGILFPAIGSIKKINEKEGYSDYAGYLGGRLHQGHKTTGLIGNSDTDKPDRSAALLVTDGTGWINFGAVDGSVVEDPDFPGGKRTDYQELSALYRKYKETDFLVMDLGDLTRLEYYKTSLSNEQFEREKAKTIHSIGQFFKYIADEKSPDTTILLLSSFASKSDLQAGFKLTPMLVYKEEGGGFLYSQSTKREGILVNTDIADYILHKLGLGNGSHVSEIKDASSPGKMPVLKQRLLAVSKMRLPVLTWYAIFEIICAVIGLLYVIRFYMNKKPLLSAVKVLLLTNIAAPAVLMYMAVLDIVSPRIYFCGFILLSLCIGALIHFAIRNEKLQFLAAALLVNGSLSVDLLRGSAWIKNSVFGYDPIIGARFYGIGNEFGGVFIGSGLLLAGCIMQHFSVPIERNPKKAGLLLFLFVALQLCLMGLPSLGANFGGTIAAICGYFFFFLSYRQKGFKVRQLAGLFIALAGVMAAIIAADLVIFKSMSHVGRFVLDIKENGFGVLYATFGRKLAMNFKLIKYTIWTKVLLCIILIITVMFFRPVQLLKEIFRNNRYLTAAWLGISAGSIAGLICNDSGIVMAATAMIFTGYTILYMCLHKV